MLAFLFQKGGNDAQVGADILDFAIGLGCFALLLVLEFSQDNGKKKRPEGDSGVDA